MIVSGLQYLDYAGAELVDGTGGAVTPQGVIRRHNAWRGIEPNRCDRAQIQPRSHVGSRKTWVRCQSTNSGSGESGSR